MAADVPSYPHLLDAHDVKAAHARGENLCGAVLPDTMGGGISFYCALLAGHEGGHDPAPVPEALGEAGDDLVEAGAAMEAAIEVAAAGIADSWGAGGWFSASAHQRDTYRNDARAALGAIGYADLAARAEVGDRLTAAGAGFVSEMVGGADKVLVHAPNGLTYEVARERRTQGSEDVL